MIPAAFDYQRAESADEAIAKLDAATLAEGSSLATPDHPPLWNRDLAAHTSKPAMATAKRIVPIPNRNQRRRVGGASLMLSLCPTRPRSQNIGSFTSDAAKRELPQSHTLAMEKAR
jgi:hypothetical protein